MTILPLVSTEFVSVFLKRTTKESIIEKTYSSKISPYPSLPVYDRGKITKEWNASFCKACLRLPAGRQGRQGRGRRDLVKLRPL